MNYAFIIGKLAKEPRIKAFNDKYLIKLTLVTVEEERKVTEFTDVSIFRKDPSFYQSLKVNDTLSVEGRVRTNKYEDKNGKTAYYTGIDANKIQKIKP